MKIVVLLGSPRKKDGYQVCTIIEEKMKTRGTVSFEYINISKLNIEACRGCELCLTKGDALCPIKDDLITLRMKLQDADGIIFNSPVYACHITGSLKKVIDRLSYLFHRPELVGKPTLTVVTTAGGGLKETSKYLKMTAVGWGCNLIGEIKVISTFFFENRWVKGYFSSKYVGKMTKYIHQKADAFFDAAQTKKLPIPTLYDVYMFNALKSKTYISEADYDYWKNKGWLDTKYYYKTSLGPVKQLAGGLMNWMIKMALSKIEKKELGI